MIKQITYFYNLDALFRYRTHGYGSHLGGISVKHYLFSVSINEIMEQDILGTLFLMIRLKLIGLHFTHWRFSFDRMSQSASYDKIKAKRSGRWSV